MSMRALANNDCALSQRNWVKNSKQIWFLNLKQILSFDDPMT